LGRGGGHPYGWSIGKNPVITNFHTKMMMIMMMFDRRWLMMMADDDDGASHNQADAQRGEKSTFKAIHIQSFVLSIVDISYELSKTRFKIS
jgi:hypothetical protein